MGLGPIPRSNAREYADEIGVVDDDAFDRFWSVLRSVDAEYLTLANASSKDVDVASDKDKPKSRAKPVTSAKKSS